MALTEEYLDFLDEEVGSRKAGFTIDDPGKADWACRKIAQARRRQAERAAFVQAKIERLQSWKAKLDEQDQRSIDFLTGLLHVYFERLRATGELGHKKSYRLPHGLLQLRSRGPKFAKDEATLLTWAKTNRPDVIQLKPVLQWSELKKDIVITSDFQVVDGKTGTLIEGLTVASKAKEEFSVKIDGEGI